MGHGQSVTEAENDNGWTDHANASKPWWTRLSICVTPLWNQRDKEHNLAHKLKHNLTLQDHTEQERPPLTNPNGEQNDDESCSIMELINEHTSKTKKTTHHHIILDPKWNWTENSLMATHQKKPILNDLQSHAITYMI